MKWPPLVNVTVNALGFPWKRQMALNLHQYLLVNAVNSPAFSLSRFLMSQMPTPARESCCYTTTCELKPQRLPCPMERWFMFTSASARVPLCSCFTFRLPGTFRVTTLTCWRPTASAARRWSLVAPASLKTCNVGCEGCLIEHLAISNIPFLSLFNYQKSRNSRS